MNPHWLHLLLVYRAFTLRTVMPASFALYSTKLWSWWYRQRPPMKVPDVLLPYLQAKLPDSQHQAIARRKIGRRARSRTKRPILLAELEARYADSS